MPVISLTNLVSAQMGACMHLLVSIHTWGSFISSDAGNHRVAVKFYELGDNLLGVCAVALPRLVGVSFPAVPYGRLASFLL